MGSGEDCNKLEHYILSKEVSVLQLQPTVAMRESRASMARPSGFPGEAIDPCFHVKYSNS